VCLREREREIERERERAKKRLLPVLTFDTMCRLSSIGVGHFVAGNLLRELFFVNPLVQNRFIIVMGRCTLFS
jgi:hypothetical protein